MSDLFSSTTMSPERQLWCAVIRTIVNDLTHEWSFSRKHQEAVSWIGTYPNANFRMVCDLADLNPEAVHPILYRLAQIPEEERMELSEHALRHLEFMRRKNKDRERRIA